MRHPYLVERNYKFLPRSALVCARLRDALGAQEGRGRGELRLLRDGRHLHAKGEELPYSAV